MRRLRPLPYLVATAALAAAAGTVRAQQPSAASALTPEMAEANRQIIREIRQTPHLMANLEYLCDVIGPRLTGSAPMQRASEWTAQKFREYGLSNVRLEKFTIARGWSRGHARARVLEPAPQTIELASAGWAPSTPGTVRGEVVFVDARTAEDLDQYRGRLKGAIVLTRAPRNIERPAPPKITGVPTPLPAEAQPDNTPSPFSPQGQALRRRLGPFLKEEDAACVFYDSGLEHSLLNMTSREGAEPFTPGAVPAAFVTSESYRLLWRLMKRGPVKVEVEIKNRFTDGPVDVYNTVADVPGSERPDEYVILGAHLDSWDLGTGATDNGTGCMAVLETARTLKALGLKPKRTIRFILFNGEEQGLVGSEEYVKQHQSEMPNVSAVLVHDYGTGKVNNLSLQGQWQAGPVLEQILEPLRAVGFEGMRAGSLRGTDHLSFLNAGVPGFACWQDGAEYDKTHHSQSDTFDKVWDDDLRQGTMVLSVFAYNMASLPYLLPREKRQGN